MSREGAEVIYSAAGPMPPGGFADLMAKINIAMPDDELRIKKSMSIDEIPDSKSVSVVKSAFMQAEDELAELEIKFAQLAAQVQSNTTVPESVPAGVVSVPTVSVEESVSEYEVESVVRAVEEAAKQLSDCILNAADSGVRFRAKVK